MIGKKWNDTRLQNLQKTCGDCTNRRCGSQHFSLCFFCVRCVARPIQEWSFQSSGLSGTEWRNGVEEGLWGFAPTRRGSFALLRTGSFVSAKGPKTRGAQARPFGCLCHSPEWFGLRNSLRSHSPRLQLEFGTAAQPRLQAPGCGICISCHPRLDRGSRRGLCFFLSLRRERRWILACARMTERGKTKTTTLDPRLLMSRMTERGKTTTTTLDPRVRKDDRKRNDGGAQPRLQAPWIWRQGMALFSPLCHPRLDRGSRVFASSCLCEENDTGSS